MTRGKHSSGKSHAALRRTSTPSSRVSDRSAARRRRFIVAARSVFHEKGYAAATIDDIMARTGGSRGTLQIITGIQIRIRRLFQDKIRTAPDAADNTSEFLADMFLAIVLADTQMAVLTGLSEDGRNKARLLQTRQRLRVLLALREHVGAAPRALPADLIG